MNHSISSQLKETRKKHTRRNLWRRVVTGMACVVVFCTVYALILPAITMEQNVFCGYEEHVHTQECYGQITDKVLICSAEHLGLHVHGEDCYDTANELVCGELDYVAHGHDSGCYDAEGNLICPLPVIEGHVHTEQCYTESQETAPIHVHADDCVEHVKGELVCSESEADSHRHEDACYEPGTMLLCTQPEDHIHGESCMEYPLICTKSTEPHHHNDGCFESAVEPNCGIENHDHESSCYAQVLICELDEGAVHEHGTECYAENPTLVCQLEERHQHTDSCYESVLVCNLTEQEGHRHSDQCYSWEDQIVCGLEEGQPEPTDAADSVLICELPTPEVHVHDASCFAEQGLGCAEDHEHNEDCEGYYLICERDVHEHELACYSDPDADVESASVWEKTLERVELTGDARKDLLAIAQTQLGYAESEKNYDVWEDQTMHGYTRYGDWYGDQYGDWCAMFVSFCLNYANLDEIPYHRNVTAWIEDLNELEIYRPAGEYSPIPGDLIFFDLNENEDADHIGIVEEIIPETEYEEAQIKVLEGNSSNCVQYVYYRVENPVILGFAELPEKLTEFEITQVASVKALIDALPAEADPDALTPELISDIEHANQQYQLLTDEQKEYVHNADLLAVLIDLLSKLEQSPVEYNCGIAEEHTHSDDCYDVEGNLICGLTEHIHTEDCIKQNTYYCGLEEHTHGDDCYDEEDNLICELEVHTHSDACMTEPLDSPYHCGMEEHAHSDDCYDEDGNLVCSEEKHAHIPACEELEGEALTRVLMVVAAIDAIPSADEIDAEIEKFQALDDEDGEIAYLEQVFPMVQQVYWQYQELGETYRPYVTNADKLMALEYIWSAATLDNVTYTSKVYNINSYTAYTGCPKTQECGTVMFVGSSVKMLSGQSFTWWKEVVVEWQGEYMRVVQVNPSGEAASKVGHAATDTGFILLFHAGVTEGFPYNVAVGDYVTTDFFIHQDGDAYAYNANGYGSVTITKDPPSYNITSAPTTVLQYQENGGRVAHTSDFVDLNIYDYNYAVNNNWRNNSYYPGFQWPGGAFMNNNNSASVTSGWNIGRSNYTVDRHIIDSVNFGDSIVNDHEYADSKSAYDGNSNGKYGKAVGATSVGKTYKYWSDGVLNERSGVGRINMLWWDYNNTSADTITNRPVSFSSTGNKAMKHTLVDGAPVTCDGISLKYLFPYDNAYNTTNAQGVTKKNSKSVDGLFQVNPVSGLYYFNSRDNHAEYSNDKFTLYAEKITPNFILYPFGNFLPFNSINTQATQVGAFNYSGGMKNYINGTTYRLQRWMAERRKAENYPSDPFADVYGYSSRYQLGIMLNEYAEDWYLDGTGAWDTLTSGEALYDFFEGASAPDGASPTFTQSMLNGIYNIDWDQNTDFFFGMDMSMEFLMPKDGLAGNDNGDNDNAFTTTADGTFIRAGEPDGIPDYPMVFNFSGDDDVWVYIDDMLFLDLTGIHRHVGGTIDFQTGTIYYFGLDVAMGDTSQNIPGTTGYYATRKFSDMIYAAYGENGTNPDPEKLAAALATLEINPDGTYGTFKDYTTHSFKFFYMERGSGSSVCRINFNFPLLQKNSISVSKEVDSNVTIQGDPDYLFQVMKANSDGSKTQDLFIGANTQFSIYDSTNTKIGTGTTDSNGVFTLKAGQRAEFAGIDENSGKYYVRELLDGTVLDQYGKVTVSGETTTTSRNVTIGSDTFAGMDSPVKDISDGVTAFRFINDVEETKLGSLSVSKQLQEYPTARDIKYFDIEVTLDGNPIAAGTKYTVGEETRTVQTPGILTIAANEKATIDNVLAGTKFTVKETSDSAEGYIVTYSAEDGYRVEQSDGGVSGVILTKAEVQIIVRNAEQGADVTIPGTKALLKSDGSEHTYTFRLTEVTDKTGETEKEGGIKDYTATATAGEADGTFAFKLSYVQAELSELPMVFYYRITEDTPQDSLPNETFYVAEVTLALQDGNLTAAVTNMWKDGQASSGELSADFTNILTGSLTLSKRVSGSNADDEFQFTIELEPGDSGLSQLSNEYSAVLSRKDGTTETVTVVFTDGVANQTLKNGDSLKLTGIPCGVSWTITETDSKGYLASYTVNGSESTEGTVASGIVSSGDTVVGYTNTMLYELPETGGAGTYLYTLGGLLLMMAAAISLYIHNKRRREVA